MSIILTSGMMRSGSTWSYNVCRLLGYTVDPDNLQLGYGDYANLAYMIKETNIKNSLGIFKTHFPSDETVRKILDGKIANIYTYRDPRDAVISRQNFQTDEDIDESIRLVSLCIDYLKLYVQKPTTLIIKYDDIITHPEEQIRKIISYLGIKHLTEKDIKLINENTNQESVNKIIDIISGDSTRGFISNGHVIDKLTQLHGNHITNGKLEVWKTVSKDMRKLLTNSFKYDLDFLGYERN